MDGDDENVKGGDDAETFVSSHLLFSHLLEFDAQKNTLSQLNKANRASLYQKGIQREARGGDQMNTSSRYFSPTNRS